MYVLPMKRKRGVKPFIYVVLALSALAVLIVTKPSHEPSPACLSSHTETVQVPITTFAGKVPVIVFVPSERTVCDVRQKV